MTKKILTLIILFYCTTISFAQEKKAVNDTITIKNGITVTNNGVSVIPTFSLGKPAAIFDLSIAKNRFSFDPQFRFAIENVKPWSFVFWMRYKLMDSKKFKIGIGAHPAFVFQTTPVITNGISNDLITTKRFFAGELVPTYTISKKVSIGLYYLYSHGVADATRNTNFISVNGYFSNIKLLHNYNLKIVPQIYYLKMDSNDGFYSGSTITLVKNKIPLLISSTINKKINSTIPSKDFLWNLSLTYSFGGKYTLQKQK